MVACIDRRALTLGKELLRRDHDFLALEPLHAGTDRLEQADEVARRQLRRRGEAELCLDVRLVEQQDAACVLAVATCSARLLQVVLQRARNVGVDDERSRPTRDPPLLNTATCASCNLAN